MKNFAKGPRKPFFEPFREPPNRPPNIKSLVPAFVGDRFVEKEDPSSVESRDKRDFSIKQLRTFGLNEKF